MTVRRLRASDYLRTVAPDLVLPAPDLLTWSERYREFNGQPMRVPAPLRELYRDTSPKIAVMKGAQLGVSEWLICTVLHTADTGRAGRGNTLYILPGGNAVSAFVQLRVTPAIDVSHYLAGRVGQSGRSRDPDSVAIRRVGPGYTHWRTSGSRAGLKSVPADTLVLDELDEMDVGTLELAMHRLDSSRAPLLRVASTPTYPGVGIDVLYAGGDRQRFQIPCLKCGRFQALEWENVRDGIRVCRHCGGSLEAIIRRAWEREGVGRWKPADPGAPYRSYHLSRLYWPDTDIAQLASDVSSSDLSQKQEAWNQHLGLPLSPPGSQLSIEELQRASSGPSGMADLAGVQGCLMGIDVGSSLHCCLLWPSDRWGEQTRLYLAGAYEVDGFGQAEELMARFGVEVCVVDAHPEQHGARELQGRHPGVVYLADYVPDRLPPAVVGPAVADPRQRYRVTVDRTGAMDAVASDLRSGNIILPVDANAVPGLFAHLQAPARRLVVGAGGKLRAHYDEGAKPDHYYHALVYAELALVVAQTLPRSTWW